jgi:hypothetical protein
MSFRHIGMVLVALCLMAPVALAQDNGGGRQGGERQGGERQRFDPAQMRQQMLDRMKEQMQASDEEWSVIAPKLEKVWQLQRDSRGGAMGGWGGRGGRGGDANRDNQPTSAVANAARELRTALEDSAVSPQSVAEKLAAYRAARDKAAEELKTAREDLKGLLTPRQEAVLVMMSILE